MPPFMSCDDAANYIQQYRKREREYLYSNFYHRSVTPPATSFISTSSSDLNHASQKIMNILDKRNDSRMKICSWAFNIVDYFDFDRQTAAIGMDIFDRFMATRGNQCTPDFALLSATTALFISIKINEDNKIKSQTLAKFSRNQFCSFDIEEMEMEILQDLTWLVHPPTTSSFLFALISFLPNGVSASSQKVVFEKSQYITELSVFDSFFIDLQPSITAFAAIMITLDNEIRNATIPSFSLHDYYHVANKYIQLPESQLFNIVQKRLTDLIFDQIKNNEDNHSTYRRKQLNRNEVSSPKSTAVFEF